MIVMFPAAIAARSAARRIRSRRQNALNNSPISGFEDDAAIAPATRILARYWWALPITGIALYASYRLRKREGRGKQSGEIILDGVNILAAVSGIIALLELEASKDAPIQMQAQAVAAGVHDYGDEANFDDFPEAERVLLRPLVPFEEE